MKHFIHPLKLFIPMALIITTVFLASCASSNSGKPGEGPTSGDKPQKALSFSEQDSNSDGYISKSEFKGPSELFEKLDSNNDNRISKEELKDMPEPPQGRPPKR